MLCILFITKLRRSYSYIGILSLLQFIYFSILIRSIIFKGCDFIKKILIVYIVLFIFSFITISNAITPAITTVDVRIFDNAKVLSNEDEITLINKCIKIEEENDYSVHIYTFDSIEGEIYELADKLVRENKHWEYKDGIVIVLSKQEKLIYINISPNLEGFISQQESQEIFEDIIPLLNNDNYGIAIEKCIDNINNVFVKNMNNDSGRRILIFIISTIVLLLFMIGYIKRVYQLRQKEYEIDEDKSE